MHISHRHLVSMFSCCFHVCCFSRSVCFRGASSVVFTPLSHCRTNHVLCRVQYSGGQHRALYARNCPPSCHKSRSILVPKKKPPDVRFLATEKWEHFDPFMRKKTSYFFQCQKKCSRCWNSCTSTQNCARSVLRFASKLCLVSSI